METHLYLITITWIKQEKNLSRPRRKILQTNETVSGGILLFLQINQVDMNVVCSYYQL